MSFTQQAELLFPEATLIIWFNELKEKAIDLKPNAYRLLQQMLMVFMRRLVRLSSITCQASIINRPCTETVIRHLGWPKDHVNQAIKVLEKNKKTELDHKQLQLYYEAFGWKEFMPWDNLTALLFYVFSILIVDGLKDSQLGRRKALSGEDLLLIWNQLSSSAKIIINDLIL